jgi:hypothetical protein
MAGTGRLKTARWRLSGMPSIFGGPLFRLAQILGQTPLD